MKNQLLILVTICCLLGINTKAQVSPAYSARLQTVLDSMCERYHIKGASAAIYVPGSGVWKGAHGESYSGNPITTDMIFGLGSNTKTYIAALMLKLQEEGALQLTDTIGRWIQNRPNINGQITIKQLLNHTSGLYSYTDSSAFGDSLEADFTRIWQPQEMLQFVGAPLFAPGSSWSYSNTNYLLAGMIIAQVTGMPVQQALRNKILTPQSLNNTWFYPQENYIGTMPHVWFFNGIGMVDGLSFSYTHEAFLSAANAAGALISTAEDNVNFWHKMMAGQIINQSSMGQWRETFALNNSIGYGLGVFRYRNFNAHVIYSHGGTGAGFINENIADSTSGVCISLLTNQDSADNDILLNVVIKALHKITINPPTAVQQVAPASTFIVYPNPASDLLNITTSSRDYNYTIINAIGSLVMQGTLTGNKTSIAVKDLPRGTYYLQLSGKNNDKVVKPFTLL